MADLRNPAKSPRQRPFEARSGRRIEASDSGREWEAPQRAIRPRIGVGPRREQRATRTLFQTPSALHLIAIATSLVILGGGLGLTLHLLGSNHAPEPERAASPATARPPRVASPGLPTHPAPAETAASTAAAVSAAAAVAADPEPSAANPNPPAGPAGAAPERPAAASGVLPVPAAAPTADDFKRPAFLEPMPADGAADDTAAGETPADAADGPAATADAEAVAAPEPDSLPTAPAPLPQQRPARIATGAASAQDATPAAATGGTSAKLTMDVTFRSSAQRGSSVLGTLSQGTEVQVIACKSWCEIIANGKRGFVFNNALPRSAR